MLFNSYAFIFGFLPIMFFGYFFLLKQRLVFMSKIWLVAGSLFFYGYWNFAYVPLLLLSVLVNFYTGSCISRSVNPRSQKLVSSTITKKIINQVNPKQLFIFGLIFNIGLLAYFKYTDFFIFNINNLIGSDIALLHIVLPLGISFFTITQIAFLVDSYEGLVEEYNLVNYMLFATYFPHLLSGPVLHHKDMIPQFCNKWNLAIKWHNVAKGLFLFSIGLFKKVIIADTFATWANAGFDTAITLNLIEAWATSLSYTLQLYFDFSGYSDMAIGMSLLFNIKLPINFNSPYKATSIIEYWKRWHITLSNFITSYIYTPLVRSYKRITFAKAMVATFVTMIIAGIWHGAGWGFVIFGGLHGIALIINNYWRKLKFKLNSVLSWFITFNFVNIGAIFFRAKDFSSAKKVLLGMFTVKYPLFSINFLDTVSMWIDYPLHTIVSYSIAPPTVNEMALIYSLVMLALTLYLKNTNRFIDNNVSNKKALLGSSALTLSMIKSLFVSSPVFLYFNF